MSKPTPVGEMFQPFRDAVKAWLDEQRERDARRVRLNVNGWAPDDFARQEREAQMREALRQEMGDEA